jgi:hypothetical protein
MDGLVVEPGIGPGAPPPEKDQTETPGSGQTPPQLQLDDLSPEARVVVEARLKEMQGDYTRKTQEVADQRREVEAHREKLQWMESLEKLFETDPAAAARILRDTADKYDTPVGKTPPGGANGPDPNAINWDDESDGTRYVASLLGQLMPVLQKIGTEMQTTSTFVATEKQKRELVELHSAMGEFDDQVVLAEAKKNPGVPLDMVIAKMLLPELEKRATDKAYANIEAKKVSSDKRPSGTTQPGKQPVSNVRDAFKQALAQHNLTSLTGR